MPLPRPNFESDVTLPTPRPNFVSSVPLPRPRPPLCNDIRGGSVNLEDLDELALATDVCAFEEDHIRQNCIQFLEDESIPQDALEWTLKVLKNNLSELKMNQCTRPPPDHYSNHDRRGEMVMTNERLKQGIKNKCQIMINDTRQKFESYTYRATYYYLDLCTGEKRTGYFNLGSGTFKNDYANSSGKHTTVLGAFLTSDHVFSYNNGGSKYNPIKRRLRRVPSLALFGLQNTNNRSGENYKYMHVSPHRSSWGCPSLSEDDYDIIDTLGENGPSLVVNYGPEDKMEDPAECSE